VRVLLDGRTLAGEQQVTWNGLDDQGHSCGSGVYLALLELDGKRISSQLTLLR
jgi:hypothetical protein